MFSWPMFLLDARPYLLLKSRKNSNTSFLYACELEISSGYHWLQYLNMEQATFHF